MRAVAVRVSLVPLPASHVVFVSNLTCRPSQTFAGASNNTITFSSTPRDYPCNDIRSPLNCPRFISTPKVVEAGRTFFGCNDLPGVELENNESACFFIGQFAAPVALHVVPCRRSRPGD